jgi:hypothetical protein
MDLDHHTKTEIIMLNKNTILITGGTGSFHSAVLSRFRRTASERSASCIRERQLGEAMTNVDCHRYRCWGLS